MPTKRNKAPEEMDTEEINDGLPSGSDTKSKNLKRLKHLFKKAGDGVEFGPFKEVIVGIKDIFERVEDFASTETEYTNLRGELDGLLEIVQDFLDQGLPPKATASMKSICGSIEREIGMIQNKLDRGRTERKLATAQLDIDAITQHYRNLEDYVRRLSLNTNFLNLALAQEQLDTNLMTLGLVQEHVKETRMNQMHASLDRLNPVHSASYNSKEAPELNRGLCTPQTRVDVLAQMGEWARDQQSASVYWTNGMAGTGKTTISYSLCSELESSNLLAASFFCTRSLSDCKDVNRIIPTIAYQIAEFSEPYSYELFQTLQNNRDITHRMLETQFENLIVKPLLRPNVRKSLPNSMVVVIDALDECEVKQSTGKILRLLLSDEYNLPIKFFVFSRPEVEIRQEMTKQQNIQKNRLVLHELDKAVVRSDIRKYLEAAFSNMKSQMDESQQALLSQQIGTLAQRSGELFIYAATAVRYICDINFAENPLPRFQQVLMASGSGDDNPHKSLDSLYSMVLEKALNISSLCQEDKNIMKLVLDTVICAQEPLTICDLTSILQLGGESKVRSALQPLWSVLHVMESSQAVTTLHASFPDFMLDPGRSKEYHCRATERQDAIVQSCFATIRGVTPGFNICGLESSFTSDDNIPDLSARVQKAIPSLLFYACRYWSAHLSSSSQSPNLIQYLGAFLARDLLLWMEVLNLKKAMGMGPDIIQRAVECCLKNHSSGLIDLARDAGRFVASFAGAPVSQSTPHIYVSMIPFWPDSAPITKIYRPRMLGMAKVEGKAVLSKRTKPALLAEWPLGGKGNAGAISPDGKSLAIAVANHIKVIDSSTGRELLNPMGGHGDAITSIDFSPDGTRIVSGSLDRTVRVWDTHNGREILPAIMHEKGVFSVAFSPRGNIIASGCGDFKVRIWDIDQEEKLMAKFKGHTSSVYALSFSPDGNDIVSGSNDWSIRVWDILTKTQRLGPPSKRRDLPNQVLLEFPISPDSRTELNQKLQSVDNKLSREIKAEQDRESPPPPPTLAGRAARLVKMAQESGVSNSIYSVAFSPDGSHMVSGCRDGTLRLWVSQKGIQESSLFSAASTSSVTCAKFTPDGAHIISGAADGSVCVWGMKSRRLVLGPLSGHLAPVTWVGCSNDASRIFSVSADATVRVWDLQSKEVPLNQVPPQDSKIIALGFSNSGTRVISGVASVVRLWDTQSCQVITSRRTIQYINTNHTWTTNFKTKGIEICSVAVSPDGKRVAYASDDLLGIWDWQSKQNTYIPQTSKLHHMVFSPDGTIIYGANSEGIQVLYGASSLARDPIKTDSRVNCVETTGPLLAAGLENGLVRIGGLDDPFHLHGHEDQVLSIAFSPDSLLLASGSCDRTLRVWNIKYRKGTLDLIVQHTGPVNSVKFSPNGSHLVSASGDQGIYVWDVQSGSKILGPLVWHTNSVHSVSFLHDTSQIASIFSDESIVVWNVRTLKPLDKSGRLDSSSAWSMQDNGWITDGTSKLLIWIPYDLRSAVLPVRAVSANHPDLRVTLKLEGANIGESWVDCYRPDSLRPTYGSLFWEWGKRFFW